MDNYSILIYEPCILEFLDWCDENNISYEAEAIGGYDQNANKSFDTFIVDKKDALKVKMRWE